jgi:dUTP pyrophosphatase
MMSHALDWASAWSRRTDTISDLRVVLTAADAAAPTRAYADDAGIDLYTAKDTTIEPGDFVDIHTTVEKVQLPDGYWGMITGRSSTLRTYRLHVPQAVIDPGWRGPLFVGAWNLGGNPVHIKAGQRIGQLILIPNNPAAVRVVDMVDAAPRGESGFGSSG